MHTNHVSYFLFSFSIFVYLFFAMLHSMWDLSSPTRDRTWVHSSESPNVNHWTARIPSSFLVSGALTYGALLSLEGLPLPESVRSYRE